MHRSIDRSRTASLACFALAGAVLACASCRSAAVPNEAPADARRPAPEAPPDLDAAARALLDAARAEPRDDAGASDAGDPDAALAATPETDPMSLHRETREELLSLFSIKDFTEKEKDRIKPDSFLRRMFDTDGPRHANQGNKDIARHTISRERCLEGLRDVVIQTPEQRASCGAENMVPVWLAGKEPWFCIDVFEFPNKACELPMVWTQPPLAKKVCELQGKRLCSDIEWNVACRGDPEGGPDQRYAYGDRLDLEICHTNLRHRRPCVVKDSGTTWKTCTTDTEPSGAFPRCRSRFGVFDQHGNVAEVMMRRDGDRVVTQLKGSAWFYVELAKEPKEPVPATTTNKSGAYPDHCNFDPRWHVEPLESAMHVNYHLGFRCCKSIP